MSFDRFHPAVREWFTTTLGDPTSAQLQGWDSIARGQHTLIAAPTGSGKTLAAFLTAIDELIKEGLEQPLPDEVRVLYVSPLKALSADIHKNLAEPRRGIRQIAQEAGLVAPKITAAVRTGDTTASERAAMLRTPPHILVTTPESLYLLLTAERSRQMLRTVRTVIVDEIHAVIGTRRGAHLSLSLERLQRLAERPLLRLGLSATQKPIDEVARFLVGTRWTADACTIVNEGHRRRMDLGVEIPRSPLDAVMSQEVWDEYYDRLGALVTAHKTTLIFVNTRRMAERIARHLSDRLGEEAVTAHHGSLSKETRLHAEARLKDGSLRALVATASLELGIDIGHVDLVCQIGSPRRIATLLQRVGRSGHTISGVPKGRVFPTSRDDLVECAALLRSIDRGELDAIVPHDTPLDVLTQQIVAESASRDCSEEDLFALVTSAWPYRELSRKDFDAVLRMAADGFDTRRGRRAALVHHDEVNHVVRGRRGSRLLAQVSGGAIPEVADYRVILDPGDTFIGTLNEDFAIESMGGDVFQLGNSSWRVLQVAAGTVRVADARGVPPNIPFWFGEAPSRSDELSRAVSSLRAEVDQRLASSQSAALEWLIRETGLTADAADQLIAYFQEGRRALGVIPSQETLVLERFFDESGGMQLVLHAPFGARINKAWGLALRKRFCRQFNFELQAAATDDAVLLSLGPQHSFPLADVFRYLHPHTTRDVLVQAFLDAPVFQSRWRWNTTIALAVPRNRNGKKLAPQLQRMLADDLMAAVFPDAAACLENIPGDRQIPDHPLVNQTVRDCLQEAMDFDGFSRVLERIHRDEIALVARDTPEPSFFAHEILNARPYAFLDDAPLEERRAHAVQSRRTGEPSSGGDLGRLDQAAIDRVRDEIKPQPRDADELHDALLSCGFLTRAEVEAMPAGLFDQLLSARRACMAQIAGNTTVAVTSERIPELLAIVPAAVLEPRLTPPASRSSRAWRSTDALVEILRGRLTIAGPITSAELSALLSIPPSQVDGALLALEADGVVLRGRFSPAATSQHREPLSKRSDPGSRFPDHGSRIPHNGPRIPNHGSRIPAPGSRIPGPGPRMPDPGAGSLTEWCERSLLARIHRYTLNRLRAEIEPVTPADFMRFLFAWQHVGAPGLLTSIDGLREIVSLLDGFELSASAWERAVLPARMDHYDPQLLDMLCLAGEVGWARVSVPTFNPLDPPRLVAATPVALFLREHGDVWQRVREDSDPNARGRDLPDNARRVLDLLNARGASFFNDIVNALDLDVDTVRQAIGVLVAAGLSASDGFSGLRALVSASHTVPPVRDRRTHFAGRWTALGVSDSSRRDHDVETLARTLLRRYGVVFRRVLTREPTTVPWRDLTRVYRRLEARGEIRGGRFVSGMSGEQFALPDAVERLREVRRTKPDGALIVISAADPLNLAGIITAGDRVRVAGRSRVVYRDGVPIAAKEGELIRDLAPREPSRAGQIAQALKRPRLVNLESLILNP